MSKSAVLDRPEAKAVGSVEAIVKAVKDSTDPNGEFEAILSMATLDRDGEVIDAKAFEPLPDHIGIDIDHGMSVLSTVGSGTPFYDGDVLKIRGTFASTDRGQEVRTLVTEGHIRKMSVAFMNPTRKVVGGVPHITKGELLNAAIVAIPANREADITAAKRALLKVGARNSGDDSDRLQQIHDLAVENGAECKDVAADEEATDDDADKAAKIAAAKAKNYKTVAGSYEQRAELLRSAIRTQHPEAWWVRIIATFEDSVTYSLESWDDEGGTYSATYSVDADVVTLGEAQAVEVTEVISPKDPSTVDPEKKAAAPAAALTPADTALAVLTAEIDELQTLV